MIENIFLLKLVLSFLVGGGYLVSVVAIAEKFGPKVGGILAGIPSTILIATIFIAWTEGAEVTRQSLLLIPIVIVISQIFVLAYLLLSRANLIVGILLAIVIWIAFAWPVRYLLSDISFWTSFTIGIIGSLAFGYYFRRFNDIKKVALPTGLKVHAVRFVAAGTVVALAVLFARILGPFWAGIVTTFPALFATSLYFLTKTRGNKFAKAFSKQLPISIIGSTLFVASLYILLNAIPAVLAFVVSIAVSVLYATGLLHYKNR